MGYLAVAIAVAVALLLLVLLVVPSLTVSPASGSGSEALTYSEALPIADRTASGFSGGGWALLASAGLVSAIPVTAPLPTGSLSSLHCNFTAVSGNGSYTLPAYAGNRSGGAAPAWEFIYRNAEGTVALISVVNGQGEVLGTFSGSECTLIFDLLLPVPSHVIDSSAAAEAVAPAAGTFLAAHPNASAEFAITGGLSVGSSSAGAQWSVAYSTCALSPTTSGTGAVFNATVNATTGRVVSTSTELSAACGSRSTPYTLSSSLAFGGEAILTTPSSTNLTVSIDEVANGIAWDNFTAQVQNGSTIVPSGWALSAISPTNVTLATFDPSSQTWSSGGTQAIAVGDELRLTATLDLAGDSLELLGAGSFGGSVELPL